MENRSRIALKIVVTVDCLAGIALAADETDWFEAEHRGMKGSGKEPSSGAARAIDDATALGKSSSHSLTNLFEDPNAADGQKNGATDPRAEHRHAGYRVPRKDADEQADHDCFDRDAKDRLGFLNVKEAAHARIGVIALKKAEDKTGIDERSDDELLGTQFETLRALQEVAQHSANHRARQQEDKVG